jgi:hypothetical protein
MFGVALPKAGGAVAGGTTTDPIRTDPTGTTTQPVSGTVTANMGTTNGLALDATLTGGTAKATARGGAKGTTAAADATSTASGANHQGLDIVLYDAAGNVINPTLIRALTAADIITAAQGTAAAAGAGWRVKGDQARASATIADPVIFGGRAANYPTKPASVAAGQAVDHAMDLEGVPYVRPRQISTYTAIFRLALAAASSKLAFTFVANTDKQLATIYHAATAVKRVTLRRAWVEIVSTGAVAGELQLELRQLSATTAPATGNPAITPAKRDSSIATAEATCLALPTTAGSEVAANSPSGIAILNLAASLGTASGTGLLPRDPMVITLYDEASADDEEMAPAMRAGVAEGWAIIGRSTAAIPLNFIARMVFSEE